MIGSQLGPYRLDRELGSGGMGKVWAATVAGRVPGLAEGAVVALKVVHPHLLETPGFFKRFLREAEIGKSVVHENVVRTFDCDSLSSDGRRTDFLVMEYVEGQTLRDLLKELERVPEELCRHIGREVAKGLAAIHAAGVVHRDMKPENVLITGEHVVKVMDLGVARLQDEAMRLSQTGAFVGSIHYAAPECFTDGGRNVDGRADLHALGLVLYELSCGTNPCYAETVPEILRKILHEEPRRLGDVNPQLSPFFEEVVHCLLAKKPDDRFADAAALLSVLEQGESSAWWTARSKAIRAETHRPLRRIRIPRETAVYGREQDLAKLRALFDRAKAGEGQVVVLEGEAGIGKSRVVDELIGRLQRDGEDLSFLFGSYPPGGAATASGAFSTAFREQFGADGSARYLTQTPLLVPAFDALLSGDATPTGAEPLTKDSLQTCFVHALRGLAAEGTTVLLVDDLHFATEDARSLFASLAMAVPGHRILLIGTTRPGIDEKWLAGLTRLPQTSQMALRRLGPKDLIQLLQDSLRSETLATSLGAQIALKSDGNPFFVFEIIRGLRDGQFLTQRDDGTWVSTRVIDDIQVPSSILDLVNARVADLTEEERDLLDVACCWGFEFDPTVVADAVGTATLPALKRLGQIERKHRLVRSSGNNYVFDHHQVQEALYESLHNRLREQYHSALATALETRTKAADKDPTTLDGALCVDLCEQFLKGGRGERALRYLEAAHAHLMSGCLNDAAVRLAERALAEPGLLVGVDRAETLLRLVGALDLLGRRARQEEATRESDRLAEASGDSELRHRTLVALGVLCHRTGRPAEAESAYRAALAAAKTRDDKAAEAHVTVSLGALFSRQGRLAEAKELYERGLALSREIGYRQGEAYGMGNLGNVLRSLGRPAEAKEQYERSLALSREIGDRAGEARVVLSLGAHFFQQGRLAEAMELYERGLSLSREMGDRQGEALATGNLGNVSSSLGRVAEAKEHYERGLVLSRETGDRAGEARTTGYLGCIFSSEGRLAEAKEHHERSVALSREIGFRQSEALATGNLGYALLLQGRLTEAREHFERHLALSREIGYRQGEAFAQANLGNVLREIGDAAGSEERYLTCIGICEETGESHLGAAIHLALGSLRSSVSGVESSRAALTTARDRAQAMGAPGVETLARCQLSLLPGGDPADALAAFAAHDERLDAEQRLAARFLLWRATGDRTHLVEARRVLDASAANVDAETRAAMLANLRVNREILAACKAEGIGEGTRFTSSPPRAAPPGTRGDGEAEVKK